MGVVIRQSLIGTITSYIGVAIGFVNNILLFPLALSLTEIGLIKLFTSIALLAYPFMQSGASQLAIKISEKIKNEKLGHQYLNLCHLLFFVGTIFVVSLMVIFENSITGYFYENSSLIADYYYLIIALAVFFSLGTYLQILISIKLKTVLSNIMKDVFVRVITIFLILAYLYDYISQFQFYLSFVIAWGLQATILFIYFLKLFGFRYTKLTSIINLPDIKDTRKYIFYVLLAGAGGGIVGQIDSIMSSSNLGLKYTGIYTIALYIATLIEIPKRNILKIITPLVAKSIQLNDYKEVGSLYKKSAINQLIASVLIFILLIANLEELYEFIPSEDKDILYTLGQPVVLLIGLSRVLDMSMGCNSVIMQYSSAYRWDALLIPLLAVVAIITNNIFLNVFNFELMGIALATLISITIFNVIRTVIIYRTLDILPFSKSHLIIIAGGFLSFFSVYFIEIENVYFSIAIKSVIAGSAFIGFNLITKSSEDLNQFIKKHIPKSR